MPRITSLPLNAPLLVHPDRQSGLTGFQVLGERCSGTNFISALIARNFDLAPRQALGWKHGFPAFAAAPADLLAVVVFRNPYSWLTSMYGKPWHSTDEIRALDFPAFLRHRWDSQIDRPSNFHLRPDDSRVGAWLQHDRHPITGMAFDNLCQLRNAKNRAFLGIARRRMAAVLCRHEDVSASPESFVTWLSAALQMRTRGEFVLPEGHFGWKWADRPARTYGNVSWTDTDLAFVNAELNWSVEDALGYHRAEGLHEFASVKAAPPQSGQPDLTE